MTVASNSKTDSDRLLTITGVGLLWAGGTGLNSIAPFVQQPKPHFDIVQRFAAGDGSALYGAELKDAQIDAFAPPTAHRGADRFGRLNIAGAFATALSAGFTLPRIAAGELDDVGLVLSTTFGPWHSVHRYLEELESEGPTGTSARTFANTVPNSAQGRVAMALHLKGYSTTLAGVPPLAHTFDVYHAGRSARLIAAGADELNPCVLGALSEDGTLAPQALAEHDGRPFDPKSRGAVAGEAFAGFFCESFGDARKRGALPLAHVLGYGIVADGQLADSFATAMPSRRTLSRAMQKAVKNAAILPSDVDAIVAAANGCLPLDALEHAAIVDFLQHRSVRLVTPKASAGECFGASSTIAVAAALVLIRDHGAHCVLVNTVDIGGTCTCMVLGRPHDF